MAVKYWTGTTSTDATVASNWSTGVLPAQGDIIIFDETARKDCVGDIATLGGNGVHLQAVKVTYDFVHQLGTSASNRFVVHSNLIEIDRRDGHGSLYLDLQETSTAGTVSASDDGSNQLLKLTGFVAGSDNIFIRGRVDEMTIAGRSSTEPFKGLVYFADVSASDTNEGVGTVRINGNVEGAKVYLGPWGSSPRTIDILDVAANGAAGGYCEVFTFVPNITKISTEPGLSVVRPNEVNIYTTSESSDNFAPGTSTAAQVVVGNLTTRRGATDNASADQTINVWAGTKFNDLSMEGGCLRFAPVPNGETSATMPVMPYEIAKGTIDENTVIDMAFCSPGTVTITDTAAGSSGLQIKSPDCTVVVPEGANVDVSSSAISTTVSA